MKIVTWNVHGAKRDSPSWELLSDLYPDIALLQEVGSIPESIAETFDVLSRPAIYKNGRPQRFSTAVLVKGKIVEQVVLSSEYEWVNNELEFFKGNFVGCVLQPYNHNALKVISVYSPAWPVDKERLAEVDVCKIKTKTNPNVWATDILWAALKNTVSKDEIWVVGGDYNSSETFDANWQDRNNKRFGSRSSGNAETLERMYGLGLTECLRKFNNENIIPTFRHSKGPVQHQIDHLFVSNGLYSRLEKCSVGDQAAIFGKSLSDHLPIIADFRSES